MYMRLVFLCNLITLSMQSLGDNAQIYFICQTDYEIMKFNSFDALCKTHGLKWYTKRIENFYVRRIMYDCRGINYKST